METKYFGFMVNDAGIWKQKRGLWYVVLEYRNKIFWFYGMWCKKRNKIFWFHGMWCENIETKYLVLWYVM